MRATLKVMLFVLPAVFLSQCEWLLWFDSTDLDEAVHIPDNVFLSTLVEKGADTNGDGKISHREARLIDSLDIGNSSFEGTYFHIGDNIWCQNAGAIKSLEGIEAFRNLRFLDCSDQEIPELDVTNCPDLKSLNCHNNLIEELNLSNNRQLTYLWTQENQLSSLDISQNSKLTEIQINDIPELNQVCVWVLPFPPSGVYVSRNNSPNIFFTTDCSR